MGDRKAILMDILIVLLVTGLGGFIITVDARRGHVMSQMELEVVNIFFGAVGFTLSGSIARGNLFIHLCKVAFGVWIFSLVNVIFLDYTLIQWIWGIPFLAAMMVLGGSISRFFYKVPSPDSDYHVTG